LKDEELKEHFEKLENVLHSIGEILDLILNCFEQPKLPEIKEKEFKEKIWGDMFG
jgi:hypothetical protein